MHTKVWWRHDSGASSSRFSAVRLRGRSRRARSSRRCRWSGLSSPGSADASARYVAAFRKGLNETGYVEGQNVTVEYHWLEGQYDRLPALVADLVRRQVAVIATPGNGPARLRPKLQQRRSRSSLASAKTRSGLVLSPASPGRAATRPASIFSTRR